MLKTTDIRIPYQYKKYWQPFQTEEILYHTTTKANLIDIQTHGLTPRDPKPKYWEGMKAIFMEYPKDPLYEQMRKHVLAHVKAKDKMLVRLSIRTNNQLYKSIDPRRTFQVISLDPIVPSEIVSIEPLSQVK